MKFEDALATWRSLEGKVLKSIKSGASITLVRVDDSNQRIELRSAANKRVTRSFDELRTIAAALAAERIVHVDSVLGGSGSSRNQPETLFANLPSVQWGEVSGKKHLLLAEDSLRIAGTVQRAVAERVEGALAERERKRAPRTEIVIPVNDVAAIAKAIVAVTGIKPSAAEDGEYTYKIGTIPVRLVSESGQSERNISIIQTNVPVEPHAPKEIRLNSSVVIRIM